MKLYIHSENYGLESVSETVMDCFDANTALMLKNDAKLNNIWFWYDIGPKEWADPIFSNIYDVHGIWENNSYVSWLYRVYYYIRPWFKD